MKKKKKESNKTRNPYAIPAKKKKAGPMKPKKKKIPNEKDEY